MSATVCILLATYQGESYLPAQLDSIAAQAHPDWRLAVADDGSTDGTGLILKDFLGRMGENRVCLGSGPRRGATRNFLHLACSLPHDDTPYYAFSDQDDVWEEDKLVRALAWLKSVPPETPAIYCSRTTLIDTKEDPIGMSAFVRKPPSFANALVQNIASGNTMVFNAAALRLLQAGGRELDVPAHDWWLYLAVTACGGKVRYDPVPTVRYRQHAANVIGAGHGSLARAARLARLLRGRRAGWSMAHVAALEHFASSMPDENKETLHWFERARTAPTPGERLGALKRSGVYCQSPWATLSLRLAAALKLL